MLVLIGFVAVIGTWSTTAPMSRAVAQAIPSIPPQDCGGEANGNGVLQGPLGLTYLGANTSLWQRATVAVFPAGSQSGQSYLQSIQQIVGKQPNVQPSIAPSAEASAIALANNNTGLNTRLHFASIHQGGPYNAGFHCTGLATGSYTVVATVYRTVSPAKFAQVFYQQTGGKNGGIAINASDPNLQSGFTPTYFYEIPSVNVYSGNQQNSYVTTIGAAAWKYLGSHPYGY
jgi:hypothetical protein